MNKDRRVSFLFIREMDAKRMIERGELLKNIGIKKLLIKSSFFIAEIIYYFSTPAG
jgi:hypothetical protein